MILTIKFNFQKGEKTMGKLTGYVAVAVVKQVYGDYHFAIYDDGIEYQAGDKVLVSGDNQFKTISEIISVEEAARRYQGNITSEVIGVVNMSMYYERVAKRKEAEELKKQMDKKIKEMQEVDKYEMYAKQNPELAEMLENYKKLVG